MARTPQSNQTRRPALDRLRIAFTGAGRSWRQIDVNTAAVDLGDKPGFARFTQITGMVLAHVETDTAPDVKQSDAIADVLESVGLHSRDLFDNRRSVAYDYPDRTVPRYVDKARGSFVPKYKDNHDADAPNPLYNLDALTADPVALVYVTEGEKDCDAITSVWGALAATAPHGANSPHKADWSALAGHPVVIFADHDDAGTNYARSVWELAHDAGATSVSIVHGAHGVKDAADHIAAGYLASDLVPVDPASIGLGDNGDAVVAESPADPDLDAAARAVAADVFWSSTPALDHIRRYALAGSAAPFAMLVAVLARLSSVLDPAIVLPPTIGGNTMPLNIFGAVVGKSGAGKGTAVSAASSGVAFVNAGSRTRRDPVVMPIPTGEGIARFFAGESPKPAKGDQTAVQQPRDRGFIAIEEVEGLTARAGRQGATLMPTLRSAFNSGPLGSQNADASTTVSVAAGSYVLGLVIECQPDKLGPILGDTGGTAQRLLWGSSVDTSLPGFDTLPSIGSVPPLEVPVPWVLDKRDPADRDHVPNRQVIAVPDEVGGDRGVIREHQYERVSGRVEVDDELDSYRNALRLRVSYLLSVLDGRGADFAVTLDDWDRAGYVLDESKRTRDAMIAAAADADRRVNLARAKACIERADYTNEVEQDKQDRIVDKLIDAVADNPEGIARMRLLRGFSSRNRTRAAHVLDNLLDSGELIAGPQTGGNGGGSLGVVVSLPTR